MVRPVPLTGVPRLRAALLVLPAVVPAFLVVVGGLGMAATQSLGLLPLVGEPEPGLAAYAAHREDLPTAIGLSLAISAASTLIATVVGFAAALLAVQGRWFGNAVAAASAATIPLPHIVGAASVGLLLSDSGLLARLFAPNGGWPELVGGPWWVAVVAEYSWKESAFIALVVTGALVTRSAAYGETAALLGAGRLSRLRHVVVPLALPALGVSAAIAFIYTFGSYEVAWLLGRPHPEPLPVMAVRLHGAATLTSRPEASALAVVTSAICLAAAGAAFAVLRRLR